MWLTLVFGETRAQKMDTSQATYRTEAKRTSTAACFMLALFQILFIYSDTVYLFTYIN